MSVFAAISKKKIYRLFSALFVNVSQKKFNYFSYFSKTIIFDIIFGFLSFG